MAKKTVYIGPSRVGPLLLCSWCESRLDGYTAINGSADPKPGDISMCAYCGNIQFWADDMKSFRKGTRQERRQAQRHKDVKLMNVLRDDIRKRRH